MPSGKLCEAGVLSKATFTIRPICSNTTGFVSGGASGFNKTTLVTTAQFPFICEVAMADGSYCPVCQNPDTDYKPMTHYGSSSIALGGPLDSPLRVSADKCVYLFKKQGTKADNMGSCSSMGLQPLKLLQVYENNLVKTSLKHFGNKYVWTDLIMRNKSNFSLF